jgi:hypothetical protein
MVIATWEMSRIGGYRQVGALRTENIGNLGKSREARTLKRGILTAIPDIEGSDFYPELAILGHTAISALKH